MPEKASILDTSGSYIAVKYNDGKWEIRDLKNDNILFSSSHNLYYLSFNSDGTKVIIIYSNNKCQLIDLKNNEVLFSADDVEWIDLNSGKTIATIMHSNDNRWEIRNINDGKTLFTANNVKHIHLSPKGTTASIEYKDGRWEIRNIKNRKTLFTYYDPSNIYFRFTDFYDSRTSYRVPIHFNSDGTMAIIVYNNDKFEIRNTENGKVLFTINDARLTRFSPKGTMIKINHKDDRWEIRDTEDWKILFTVNNARWVKFSSDETMAIVKYKKGWNQLSDRWETRSLKYYIQNIVFTELTTEQLFFVFNYLKKKPKNYPGNKNSKLNRIWQSFNPEQQQELQKSYIPSLEHNNTVFKIIDYLHNHRLIFGICTIFFIAQFLLKYHHDVQ